MILTPIFARPDPHGGGVGRESLPPTTTRGGVGPSGVPGVAPGWHCSLRTLTVGRAQTIPSPAGVTTVLKSEPTPDPDAVTIDPTQRMVIVFTVVGGIAGVVQTVIAALSMH